jgi:hypothetical protein
MRFTHQLTSKKPRRNAGPALLLALLVLALAALPSAALSQETPDAAPVAPAQSDAASLYLPLVSTPTDLADRIGFSKGSLDVTDYNDIESLKAGWYVDWQVQVAPQRPDGIEYMQMVRLHQEMVCGPRVTPDRVKCRYVTPHSYTFQPSEATIVKAAKVNPGSVWLIGNEPDRPDWAGGGQDEIMPHLYAEAYHRFYTLIKAADPHARIAVAGIIQMTDLREDYLDKMWAHYKLKYGTDMPVDIWNVHNFIGSEYCERVSGAEIPGSNPKIREMTCWGMGLPPDALWADGASDANSPVCSGNPRICKGAYIDEDWRHTYIPTFEAQIRRFRQWMKDHGQQNKELIVTEYGVLYTQDIACPTGDSANAKACKAAYPSGTVPLQSSGDHVRKFMTDSFDFFLNGKDCSLSTIDGCRLVQRWAWFSLDSGGYNQHGALFTDADTMSATGVAFRDWVNANFAALRLN